MTYTMRDQLTYAHLLGGHDTFIIRIFDAVAQATCESEIGSEVA